MGFLSLPSLSSPDTQPFLDRYATLVPSRYHDDFAILILILRNTCWTHGGSGGLTSLLPNGVKGVTKFSKKHNDKKRPTNTYFPSGELERLRLAARELKADIETRQNQEELARLEAIKKKQERLEAVRLEAARLRAKRVVAAELVRLKAERLEVERLGLQQLKAARLEAKRPEPERPEKGWLEIAHFEERRQLKQRQGKEERQRQELERLEVLTNEQKEKHQQEESPSSQKVSEAMRLKDTQLKEQSQLKEKQETRRRENMSKNRLRLELRWRDTLMGELENQLTPTEEETQKPKVDIFSEYLSVIHVSQTPADSNRSDVETLHQTLQEKLQRYTNSTTITVHLFGSRKSGLCCMKSDAYFTVYNFVPPFLGASPIKELAKSLRWAGFQSVTTIANARVPIVKFVSQGFQCDMSMDQSMGVLNSKLIGIYRRINKRFLTLWFAVKRIAENHRILSGSTGYLSSYALVMMVIVFLQDVTNPPILPQLQQQERRLMEEHEINGYNYSFDSEWGRYRAFGNMNTTSTDQLLLDFCQFYGYNFNYATQEVDPCLGVIKTRSYDPPPQSESDPRPKDWSICVLAGT